MIKPERYRLLGACLACLVLLVSPIAFCATTNSSWFFRDWQPADGLPEHTIVGLEQTADGYLWIATHEGLFRFDGVRFQEFTPPIRVGQPPYQIRFMMKDRRGNLWIVKDGGATLCLGDGEAARLVDLGEAQFRGQPRSIVEDGEGSIWVSDDAGSVFQIQGGRTKRFGAAEGLGPGACRLVVDVQGFLWYSQGGNVGVLRDGRFEALFAPGQPAVPLAAGRDKGIWFCSGLNIYRCFYGGVLEAVAEMKVEPGCTVVEVTALYEDRAHGLWIGTGSGGLQRYDSRGIQNINPALPAITAMVEDSEGDLWVGARGGGLNRFRQRAAEVLGLSSGLPFVSVQSVCEEASGTLWVAGQNGALAVKTNDVWTLLSPRDGWTGGGVVCLASEPGGGVLLGTREQGVFRFKQGGFTPVPLGREMDGAFIRSLLVCSNGDLWIGPNVPGMLHRLRGGILRSFALPAGSRNVRTMAEGRDSSLWAATSEGSLFQVVGDVLSTGAADNLTRSSRGIRCLLSTPDGALWIGYAGQGLGWLRNGKYVEFHREQGLWDEYISQLMTDEHGRLWMAGNRGICQVALSEFEAVAEGRAPRVRSVVLGRGDGMPHLQATFGVWPISTRSRDGRLLIPTQTGLACIQPGLIGRSGQPPQVVIELLRVNGRTIASYQLQGTSTAVDLRRHPATMHLGPGVNQMEFEFTALSLASPENVTFRYKLEGLDQDWVEVGSARTAHYPHVPPGKYRFRVTACNHDGIWNEQGDSLSIQIAAHLWEPVWFRVAATTVGSCLFAGGLLLALRHRYRLRIQRLEERQALERERTRIAQDLHDDLGAGLVEINFGSELAQDSGLPVEDVREHAREIGTRAREMVTALDEIVWAVNPRHDTVSSLATYFCQYAQHFLKSTAVKCHLEVARDLPVAPLNAEQRHSLFLAFKQALTNVIQHSGATDLRLAISAKGGFLTVAVSDNGRGLGETVARSGVGADGLENMQSRLRQLGGRCEVSSKPGQGTTITFGVPIPGAGSGTA